MDIITRLLDAIAPRRPSATIILPLSNTDCVSLLAPHKLNIETTALLPFHHPLVHALIIENKFHHSRHASELLGSMLAQWVIDEYKQAPLWIVPVPLSKERERARGYNQITEVANVTAKLVSTCTVIPLIERTRDTTPQTTLTRTERLENLLGAFILGDTMRSLCKTAPSHVILLDDVVTTGATMHAAESALAPHLPSSTNLMCVALAH